MVSAMRKLSLSALLLTLLPALAFTQATETRCTNGDLVRRVVIMSEPGVSVPCEVHYYKETEAPGDDQVLWSASSQEGYCEEQAANFVAKLEGWGWSCGAGEAAAAPPAPAEPADPPEPAEAPEAPEEPVDTTDDLAPAAPEETGNS